FGMGKTSRICNDFPGSAGFELQAFVFDPQVRTVLFEKVAFFLVVVALSEKNGFVGRFYEPDGRFEHPAPHGTRSRAAGAPAPRFLTPTRMGNPRALEMLSFVGGRSTT